MDYGLHRCSALDATPCDARAAAMRATPRAMVLDHDRLLWYWIKRDGSSVVVRQCPWCGGVLPDAIWIALVVATTAGERDDAP